MPKPEMYNVHEEMAKMELRPANAVIHEDPVDEGKLLLRTHDKLQIVTTLTHWMTFSEEDRDKKVRQLMTQEFDPDKKVHAAMRRRYLLLVIFREVMHPKGSAGVALVAFNALFKTKGN